MFEFHAVITSPLIKNMIRDVLKFPKFRALCSSKNNKYKAQNRDVISISMPSILKRLKSSKMLFISYFQIFTEKLKEDNVPMMKRLCLSLKQTSWPFTSKNLIFRPFIPTPLFHHTIDPFTGNCRCKALIVRKAG